MCNCPRRDIKLFPVTLPLHIIDCYFTIIVLLFDFKIIVFDFLEEIRNFKNIREASQMFLDVVREQKSLEQEFPLWCSG